MPHRGYSRELYRFTELYEHGGAEAFHEISRRRPNHKNRVDTRIEDISTEAQTR